MAHTKQKGSSKNNRESESKRLGVKLFGGQVARPGNVIIRQRGTKYVPGLGARLGGDDTIYAIKEGKIFFKTKKVSKFDRSKRIVNIVNVI
ncbi:MAG: 50S ribosomal protein L27 [Patescibacteria group bacterium]